MTESCLKLPTVEQQAAEARVAAGHDPEAVWRRAERDILRRERVRLFRNGTIRPPGLPNVMAKDKNGRWWPNSNFVEQVFKA